MRFKTSIRVVFGSSKSFTTIIFTRKCFLATCNTKITTHTRACAQTHTHTQARARALFPNTMYARTQGSGMSRLVVDKSAFLASQPRS